MDIEDAIQNTLDRDPEDQTARGALADLLMGRNDPRAAGYHALWINNKYAKPRVHVHIERDVGTVCCWSPPALPWTTKIPEMAQFIVDNERLPDGKWLAAIGNPNGYGVHLVGRRFPNSQHRGYWKTRREAEDAAAYGFLNIGRVFEHYCDNCDEDRPHLGEYSNHERDSSGDCFECLVCRWVYTGISGRYNPPSYTASTADLERVS